MTEEEWQELIEAAEAEEAEQEPKGKKKSGRGTLRLALLILLGLLVMAVDWALRSAIMGAVLMGLLTLVSVSATFWAAWFLGFLILVGVDVIAETAKRASPLRIL